MNADEPLCPLKYKNPPPEGLKKEKDEKANEVQPSVEVEAVTRYCRDTRILYLEVAVC